MVDQALSLASPCLTSLLPTSFFFGHVAFSHFLERRTLLAATSLPCGLWKLLPPSRGTLISTGQISVQGCQAVASFDRRVSQLISLLSPSTHPSLGEHFPGVGVLCVAVTPTGDPSLSVGT